MELFIIGVVVAANIIFILYKFKMNRLSDALLDTALLTLVTIVFMGSYAGLVVGTVASLLISVYLYYNPPSLPKTNLPKESELDSFMEEFKRRAKPRS